MSIYLCVFDEAADDLEHDGFQLGQPEEFERFLSAIENRIFGAKLRFPTLFRRADCDGHWSPEECRALKRELAEIAELFKSRPPEPTEAVGASSTALSEAESLYDCFYEVGGENLFEALDALCDTAIDVNLPIAFQ